MNPEIRDLRQEGIFDLNPESDDLKNLLEKMKGLESFFRHNDSYSSLGEFLGVYRQITSSVDRIYGRKGFKKASEMQRLDLEFASLYLMAMERFLLNEEKIRPWKNYIDYCMRDDAAPSIAMFLGINSHVNGDLLKALNSTGFDCFEDYSCVNPVLRDHLSKNLHHLVLKDHDKYAFLAEVFKPLSRYEMDQTIISWRRNAWKHRGNPGKEPVFESYAEKVAEKVIDISEATNPLTLPLEAYKLRFMDIKHFHKIKSEINQLNDLKS